MLSVKDKLIFLLVLLAEAVSLARSVLLAKAQSAYLVILAILASSCLCLALCNTYLLL